MSLFSDLWVVVTIQWLWLLREIDINVPASQQGERSMEESPQNIRETVAKPTENLFHIKSRDREYGIFSIWKYKNSIANIISEHYDNACL